MDRTESVLTTTLPGNENRKIREMETFGYSLLGMIDGKMHFSRSLGLPHLDDVKRFQAEYFQRKQEYFRLRNEFKSLEWQKKSLEEQKRALEEWKKSLEEQKRALEEQPLPPIPKRPGYLGPAIMFVLVLFILAVSYKSAVDLYRLRTESKPAILKGREAGASKEGVKVQKSEKAVPPTTFSITQRSMSLVEWGKTLRGPHQGYMVFAIGGTLWGCLWLLVRFLERLKVGRIIREIIERHKKEIADRHKETDEKYQKTDEKHQETDGKCQETELIQSEINKKRDEISRRMSVLVTLARETLGSKDQAVSESTPLPMEQIKGLLEKVDPDALQKILPPAGVVTMLFTDIVNSTLEKAKMGDKPYHEILKKHNSLLRESISSHGGYEIKTIGDAFFASFADPHGAVACALDVQRMLLENPIQTSNGPIQVRMGIHTGTPIVERNEVSKRCDLSGSDVDKASRIVSLANGNQVLLSEETMVLAKPESAYDWGPWELKGLGPHRVFEALRDDQSPQMPSGKRCEDIEEMLVEDVKVE